MKSDKFYNRNIKKVKIGTDLSASPSKLSHDEWMNKVLQSMKKQKLALILGAGVSKDSGLPQWNKLLTNTFKKCLHDIDETTAENLAKKYYEKINNPLYFARFVTALYEQEKSNPKTKAGLATFEESIKEELYSVAIDIDNNQTLNAVTRLVKDCGIREIITYNFDNLFEQKLKREGFDKFQVVSDQYLASEDITSKRIFHVHGYAPQHEPIFVNKVLNEDEFHKQYVNIYNWQNITQINIFRDYHCLFVGVSLTDPNLRRLIDISRTYDSVNTLKHYWIGKIDVPDIGPHSTDEDRKFKLLIETGRQLELESLGIAPFFTKNYSEISIILNQVADNF